VFVLSTASLLGLKLHNDYITLQENSFSFIENKIRKDPFIISDQVQADLVNIATYYLHFWQFSFYQMDLLTPLQVFINEFP